MNPMRWWSRLSSHDAMLLNSLRTRTQAGLGEVLEGAREVVLLGTPRHGNLGDSLILAGTLAYLKRLNVRILYSSDYATYSKEVVSKLPAEAPILFQGGGNFGDLYPLEDSFRRDVIAQFPARRFIALPQSIHFRSDRALTDAQRGYGAAKRLTVMVRDSASLEFARSHLSMSDALLVPDFAFGWTPRFSRRAKLNATVIARADEEVRPADAGLRLPDWPYPRGYGAVWNLTDKVGRRARFSSLYDDALERVVVSNARKALLAANIFAAEQIVSRSSYVVTNRLHGHILSCIGGIPHSVTDNSYGKVRGVFDEYTSSFETAVWRNSLSEALLDIP